MKFQTPRGTRDFLPEEMIRRQYVLDTIRRVFEKWGFDPLETPAFEEWQLLAAKAGGGEAVKEEIYYFKDKSERELGLRFDMTVPLGRVMAGNPNLPKPFKRYAIGRVWRYDRPGLGRYREFWQADVDIVGSVSSEGDAVCIATVCDALKTLGFENFTVRINNRKLVDIFVKSLGVKDVSPILRAVDKIEKIGIDNVKKELAEKGFKENKINAIMEYIFSKTEDVEDENYDKALKEVRKIIDYLTLFGFKAVLDKTLVRGLDYYTGPVFEIATKELNLSIAGGGRYDNLVEVFGGKPVAATGMSIGVERVIEIMEKNNVFNVEKTRVKLYLAPVKNDILPQIMKIAKNLINSGIPAEFDVMERPLKKQLEYVNSRQIPYCLVIGNKELDTGKGKVRDMKSGKEVEISLNNIEEIKKIICDN